MPTSVLEKAALLYARRFPIRRGKLRVITLLSKSSISGGSTQRMATLKYGGFKMPCDISEMLQSQFYYFGTYFMEQEIIESWQRIARTASVIFDVGANDMAHVRIEFP